MCLFELAPGYESLMSIITRMSVIWILLLFLLQVGFFHSYRDGVDYVFVDHPCFHSRGKDIYAGDRLEILFRCTLLCKVRICDQAA